MPVCVVVSYRCGCGLWLVARSYAWFSVQDAFEWLIISFFTFLFLTFFIEFMFSSENGDSRWRRWFCQSWRKAKANPDDLRAAAAAGGDGANADGDGNAVGLDAVIAEAKRVRDGKAADAAMTIEGLRKEYYKCVARAHALRCRQPLVHRGGCCAVAVTLAGSACVGCVERTPLLRFTTRGWRCRTSRSSAYWVTTARAKRRQYPWPSAS